MGLRKNRPKMWPNPLIVKIHTSHLWKKYLKNVGYFCNSKKLPKLNNRPLGENSLNLVTLEIVAVKGETVV
jgi:hypothetical protein